MLAVRPMPVFDTHKAVKALCHAGFDDTQAEAVVEQITKAVNDNLVTATTMDHLATSVDFERLMTKEDLKGFELRFNKRFDEFARTLRWGVFGMAVTAVALIKALDFVVG